VCAVHFRPATARPRNMEEPQAKAAAPAEELQDSIGPPLQACASGPGMEPVGKASEVEEVSHHQFEVDEELSHLPPTSTSTAVIAEADISEAGSYNKASRRTGRFAIIFKGPVGRGWRYDGRIPICGTAY
jgi:hypothetical protein